MAGQDAEVIVVGGGPAGSATAILLAGAGREVLLLDKSQFPREKPCAEYLSPGTETVLRRLGAWESVAAARPERLRGMAIYSPGGRCYLADYPVGLGWPLSDRPAGALRREQDLRSGDAPAGTGRSAYGLPRPVLDAQLLAVARARGAHVLERVHVRDLLIEGGRVMGVRAATAGGAARDLQARLVIGADGRHSIVARRLELSRPLRWPQRTGLTARYANVRGFEQYGELHVGSWGYCGLAPVGGGAANVALVVDCRRAWARAQPLATFFEQELRRWPRVRARLDPAQRIRRVMGVGPLGHAVRRCAGPGFLLVGDAAGFFDPFTGEGVYEALRGAELASAAADDALRRPHREAEALARYAAARRSELGPKRALSWVVQQFVHRPRLMDYAIERLARRPVLAHRLATAVGDCLDPRDVLSPWYAAALLRP